MNERTVILQGQEHIHVNTRMLCGGILLSDYIRIKQHGLDRPESGDHCVIGCTLLNVP